MRLSAKYGYVKPCPFCGSHTTQGWKKRGYHDHVEYFDSGAYYRPKVVYCLTCHGSISGISITEAVQFWNDRRKWQYRN